MTQTSTLGSRGSGSRGSVSSTGTCQSWTSVVTLNIPATIGDTECGEGQHQFSCYPASRSLLCSECCRQVPSGAKVHSCSECDTDLCGACFDLQKPKTRSFKGAEAAKKRALNQSLTKDAGMKEGSMERRRSVESVSTAATATSSSGEKACQLCGVQYRGFGTQCSNCRKFGATESQCVMCTQYFKGFGKSCSECVSDGKSCSECVSACEQIR